ncbi:MAG: hypothetical protein IKJ66_07735 [Bacteroidaceae bacterium]|nr:hypothetical protein [Bacteroidaceae bacterium]
MKKIGFLSVMASVLMLGLTFGSCDELLEDDSQEQAKGANAYLPVEYADKEVAAWYALTEQDDNKTKVEAVFLFKDNTFVVTKAKLYDAADGREPEYGINAVGMYQMIEGDYTNGKAGVVTSDGSQFEVEIKDGKLYAMDEVFIKMSNSLIPKAIEIVNGGGGDNGDDSSKLDELIKHISDDYANKTVAAWYLNAYSEGPELHEEAAFFFEDQTAVVMELKIHGDVTGLQPELNIFFEGTYDITQGDFQNGAFVFTPSDPKYRKFDGSVSDGELQLFGNRTYTRQAWGDYTPQNTGGEGQGSEGGDGSEGQDEDSQYLGDVHAYLPAQFAGKIAAWYLLADTASESSDKRIKMESIFLFEDGSLVVTSSKFYLKSSEREPEYSIIANGQYKLTAGSDYDNGMADVAYVESNGEQKTMTVTIQNGVLSAMNESFIKQDNADAPAPMKL